jgi:hypothetical protein
MWEEEGQEEDGVVVVVVEDSPARHLLEFLCLDRDMKYIYVICM